MIRAAGRRKGAVARVPRHLWVAPAAAMLALAVMAAPVSRAAAHAVLVGTEPADGSALETPPGEIVLRFNEPVAPVFVRVIGPDGEPVTAPEGVRAIDTELRLPLPPRLTDGGYLVSYRVISADSHPVGGSFAFGVGAAAAPPLPQPEAARAREVSWQATKILLRFVQNIALMLAAGGALFQVLVLRTGDRVSGLKAMITAGAVVALLAAVLGIGVQGGLLAASPVSALGTLETWRLGASTTVGTATLIMVPALAVLALATAAPSQGFGRIVAALAGLVAALSLALTGHSAAAGWPAQTALALHAVTVAYWLGALWPLHVIVRTRSAGEAAILVRRFSAVAVPAVALLVVAGIGTALTRIDDPAALLGSDYGRILLLKLAFVALLLAIAITNRRRLMPALAVSPKAPMALARNIRFELAIAGTILLTTAVLAHTPPPHEPAEHSHHEHVHAAVPGYTIATVSRGRTLFLEMTPARVGGNALTIWLSDADGQPLAPIEVTVALSLPAAGIEPLARVPERTGQGHYVLARLDLPTAGRWSVRVDALISDFEKAIFTTQVPIE
jgi:copper transport protein